MNLNLAEQAMGVVRFIYYHVLAACAFEALERAVCNFTLSQGLVGR